MFLGMYYFLYIVACEAYRLQSGVFLLQNIVLQILHWPYLFSALLSVTTLIVVALVFSGYKKWKAGWLSGLIEIEVAKNLRVQSHIMQVVSQATNFIKRIYSGKWSALRVVLYSMISACLRFVVKSLDDLKNYRIPSIASFTLIALAILIVFVFSHTGVAYESLLNPHKAFSLLMREIATNEGAHGSVVEGRVVDAGNLIAIISGLAALVLAQVIFIAESIRDDKDYEKRRVLLEDSRIWPLFTLTALTFLNFFWLRINVVTLLLPIVVIIGVVWSFGRTLRSLVLPKALESSRDNYLRRKLHEVMRESARVRIGNNILFNHLSESGDVKIEYRFSKRWVGKEDDYIFIESPGAGWISDIHIGELIKLSDRLETIAKDLGFSLSKGEKSANLVAESDTDGSTTQSSENISTLPVKGVCLLKRFGEEVPDGSVSERDQNFVLALPKEFNKHPGIIEEVKARMPGIFKFRNSEPSSESYRKELRGTKDRLIAAIKNLSLGEVEELSKMYIGLAEEFLSVLAEFGGGYSPEQAEKELSSITGTWEEAGWIRQDVRELLIIAIEQKNKDVFSDIAYIPVAIATRAIRAEDHLLYRQFLALIPFEYHLVGKISDDSDFRSFAIERSWRYLKEVVQLYIENKLHDRDENLDSDDLVNYESFAMFSLRICQSYLKEVFDAGDIDTFKDTVGVFRKLYSRLDEERIESRIESLTWRLESATVEDRVKIESQLLEIKPKAEMFTRIMMARDQVFFGLAAFIFEQYRLNNVNASNKEFFQEISSRLPSEIKRLTSVFTESRQFETGDKWDWDNWEMVADEEVHHIDFFSKLDRLYTVLALQILSRIPLENASSLTIPTSRTLAFIADDRANANHLIVLLDAIKADPANWNFILNQQQIDRIDILKNLLTQAVAAQEKSEEEFLMQVKVETAKIIEFKKRFLDEYQDSINLRKLITLLGNFEDRTAEDSPKSIHSWGFNQIDEKAAFISDWHVSYSGWGDHYGHDMAVSEDEIAFKEMITKISDKKTILGSEVINQIEKAILEKSMTRPIVLQTLKSRFEFGDLKRSEAFVSQYHSSCPDLGLSSIKSYMGVLRLAGKEVPVIDMFVRQDELSNKVVVAELEKLGAWVQYSPVDAVNIENKFDIFELSVTDLNENNQRRAEIVAANQSWLAVKGDANAQNNYLKQKVHTKIYQKFIFDVRDPDAGRLLTVSDKNDD